MADTATKTQPQPVTDELLDEVHGGLIGLLRSSNISAGTSNTATFAKVGAGTLVLSGGNTTGG